MPRVKRKKSKSKGRKSSLNPGQNVVTYFGPIQMVRQLQDRMMTVITCANVIPLASTGGGIIADVFGSNPSVCASWADDTAVWQQYRVLGFEVEFEPDLSLLYRATSTYTGGVGIVDRRSSTPLASINAAEGHDSIRLLTLQKKWKIRVGMDGIPDATFTDVGVPVSLNWVKLYFTGLLPVSFPFGSTKQTFRIQFRDLA